MSKNKIQNYIILEFLKNYATLLFIFSLVIWLMQAVRLLDLVYQDGNTFFVYIQYTIFQLPKIIARLSIIIFFITIFWTLNNLEESNEIKTISFFGIELKILFFKFVTFSLFFAFILIFFKSFIVPYFSKKSRNLLVGEGIGSFSNLLKENNFNSPSRNTTIYVEKKNKIGELKNIIIFQEESEINKVIIAKNGIVMKIKDESYFVTESGIAQEMDSKGHMSQIVFDKISTDIKTFKKKSADYYKFNELTLIELLDKFLNDKHTGHQLGSLSELLNMFFGPLIIPSLLLLLPSLFLSHEYKINKKLLKLYLFTIGFLLIFILEFLLSHSSRNILFGYVTFFYLISIFILNLYFAKKFFKNAVV